MPPENVATILGDAVDTVNLLGGWSLDPGGGGAGFDVSTYDSAPDIKVVVDDSRTVNAP